MHPGARLPHASTAADRAPARTPSAEARMPMLHDADEVTDAAEVPLHSCSWEVTMAPGPPDSPAHHRISGLINSRRFSRRGTAQHGRTQRSPTRLRPAWLSLAASATGTARSGTARLSTARLTSQLARLRCVSSARPARRSSRAYRVMCTAYGGFKSDALVSSFHLRIPTNHSMN